VFASTKPKKQGARRKNIAKKVKGPKKSEKEQARHVGHQNQKAKRRQEKKLISV
jgi:hypothetical protein